MELFFDDDLDLGGGSMYRVYCSERLRTGTSCRPMWSKQLESWLLGAHPAPAGFFFWGHPVAPAALAWLACHQQPNDHMLGFENVM